MMRIGFILVLTVTAASLGAQTPRTHRLEATPSTVAYGYYWSDAKPVLRVASGDILDVDTLLTFTPAFSRRSGVEVRSVSTSRMSPEATCSTGFASDQ